MNEALAGVAGIIGAIGTIISVYLAYLLKSPRSSLQHRLAECREENLALGERVTALEATLAERP